MASELTEDNDLRGLQRWLKDLPQPGRHDNRTVGVAPDGRVLLSVGSSCNACREQDEELATLLVVDTETPERSIYARGLRNTIGFDWHPVTEELWGMDHGTDWLGANTPPEELNRLQSGRHYGWPYAYGGRQPDTDVEPPPGVARQQLIAETEPPVLKLQAHTAPIAFLFYNHNLFLLNTLETPLLPCTAHGTANGRWAIMWLASGSTTKGRRLVWSRFSRAF